MVADGPSAADPAEPPERDGSPVARVGPFGSPRLQRGLAGRLFPGPSNATPRRQAEHIQALLRFPDDTAAPRPRLGRPTGRPTTGDDPPTGRTPPAVAAQSPDVSAEAAQVREALEQQSEILRAILASTVDSQTDARATAQNSRTFAWAATVIALLTFVATVVSIIAAVDGT